MVTTNVKVKFPSQFTKYINNQSTVDFEGEKFFEFIDYLDEKYGNNIKDRLFEEDGEVRPYINFFIGEKNIKSLNGMHTKVNDGDKISLLLSRAGG